MFMIVGNEKRARCVNPIKILDVNYGVNIVNFEVRSAFGTIVLKTENGLDIVCKSQDYEEYLEMFKLVREAISVDVGVLEK